MSIKHCLDSAVAQKELSQAAADELDLLYNRFVAQNAAVMGDAQARVKAQAEIAKRLEVGAAHKRRVALLQASAIERLDAEVSGYKNARGETDIAAGLLELLETHGRRDEGLGTGSLAGRAKAVFSMAVAEFEGQLEQFGLNAIGLRKNKARLENIARERFGEGIGDEAAKAIADTFGGVADGLRQRFNEAGGAIGKLVKWGLPQLHNARALLAVGFEEWSRRISEGLDWANMRHALSGEPILPDERMDVLRHVYDTVTTEGRGDALPSTQPQGRGALYKQHADHRFLVFKNADAWLAYDRDFGSGGDVFSVMMGHLKIMSRDVAAVTMLGPNPQATLQWLKSKAEIEAMKARRGEPALIPRRLEVTGIARDPVGYTATRLNRIDAMWQSFSGAADVAVDNAVADAFATARNVVTGASLGSAILSAPPDMAFGAMARSFAGGMSITGGLVQQVGTLVKGMAEHLTGAKGDRAEALFAGIAFDHLANAFGNRAREAGTLSGPVMSRYVADQVLRKQLLVAWTDTLKDGMGLFVMRRVADETSNVWATVAPPVKRLLQRYGFGEADWNVLTAARLHDVSAEGNGATILRAREIRALGLGDLGRIAARDANDQTAARQALAAVNKQVWSVSDQVAEDAGAILKAANDANLTRLKLQSMIGRVLFGTSADAVPKALRDRLMSPLAQRAELLAFLGDVRDGVVARTEVARIRWRESAEFQALPDWIKNLFADPDMTLADARKILAAMTEAPKYGALEGPPSIPTDPAELKVQRYFRDLAERYQEMVLQETTYAVPEATLRSRSFTSQIRPGTFGGELMRSMGQFKGYGFAVVQLHVGRMLNEIAAGRAGLSNVAYATGALAALTSLGMVSLQMKQLAKGEDLRDMTDWRLWWAGMVQSGAAGIYTDFFFADQNRFGGSLTGTVAGPMVGRAEKLAKATLGNIQQGSEGKKTNAGREAVNLLQSVDPLSSLWYTKAAWDRIAYSRLRRAVDPEAAQAEQRQVDTARRDRGVGFFWPPGHNSPERAPTMGTAPR